MYLQHCGNIAPCFVDTFNSHVWVKTGPNLQIFGIICVKQNIFQHCICLAGHQVPNLWNPLCKFMLTYMYFHMKLFQSGPSVYAFWASEPNGSSSALVVLEISHWKHINDIFLQTIGGPVNCTETMLTLDWIKVAVAKWNLDWSTNHHGLTKLGWVKSCSILRQHRWLTCLLKEKFENEFDE